MTLLQLLAVTQPPGAAKGADADVPVLNHSSHTLE